MINELVTVKDSKRAIQLVAEHIRGSRIKFQNLFDKQNVSITPDPYFKSIRRIKPILEPDCIHCLYEGREYLHQVPAFTNWAKGSELKAPKCLQECRKALAGIVPTIEMESEDGLILSFALSQGCRAGWGVIEEKKGPEKRYERFSSKRVDTSDMIVNPSSKDADDAHPFVFPDLKMIPVTMAGMMPNGLGTIGGNCSDDFWKSARMDPLPLKKISLARKDSLTDEYCPSIRVLESAFRAKLGPGMPENSRDYSITLELGFHSAAIEPFFWIDMIAKDGFTTRFMIDNGFPGLLFPEHFKTPF